MCSSGCLNTCKKTKFPYHFDSVSTFITVVLQENHTVETFLPGFPKYNPSVYYYSDDLVCGLDIACNRH